MRTFKTLLYSLILLCGGMPVMGEWLKTQGPKRDISIKSLAFSDSSFFAGGRYGIFRSRDSGVSWKNVTSDIFPFPTSVNSLVAHGKVVLAGTEQGLYRTQDDGQSWNHVTNVIEEGIVYSVARNETHFFAASETGVYRSDDDGLSWKFSNDGLSDPRVSSILATTNVIYAATFSGVFLSRDGGVRWSKAPGLGNDIANSFALLSRDDEAFVASGSGTYKTEDAGNTWVYAHQGLTHSPIEAMTYEGSTFYAGLGSDGIFHSIDGGLSWDPLLDSPGREDIVAIAVKNGLIIAGTSSGGLFRTSVSGKQPWTSVDNKTIPFLEVGDVASDGTNLYALVNGDGMLYHSRDSGLHWTRKHYPSFLRNIFVANNRLYGLDLSGRLSRISESGENWNPLITANLPNIVVSFAINGNEILVGSSDNQLYRSTLSGPTWKRVETFPPDAMSAGLTSHEARMAMFSKSGIYYSQDSGKTWKSSKDPAATEFLNGLYLTSTSLFAATSEALYRSRDGGSTWKIATQGIVGDASGSLFSANGLLFYSTLSDVFVSQNDGDNWRPLSSGLTARALSLEIAGNLLLAATDQGVWTCSLADLIPTQVSLAKHRRNVSPIRRSFPFSVQDFKTPKNLRRNNALGRLLVDP